jgi:aspartyl/asparaginyl-tRNA synthetase
MIHFYIVPIVNLKIMASLSNTKVSPHPVSPYEFNYVMKLLRNFFEKKGLCQVHAQSRTDIVSACEEPETITTFTHGGVLYPLKQTGQMVLEEQLLLNPSASGFYCETTSYRNEPNPIPGRHDLIFPLVEFEVPGDFDDLVKFLKELLKHLGYSNISEGEYVDVAKSYKVFEIEHKEELLIQVDYGEAFLLKNFPECTFPFWNMRRDGLQAKKIDVILSGMEAIGTAERSCDRAQMMHSFKTITYGKYAQTLYNHFGKDRVLKEIEEFLSHNFFPRFGGGIGITRLIRSMRLNGLIPKELSKTPMPEIDLLHRCVFIANQSVRPYRENRDLDSIMEQYDHCIDGVVDGLGSIDEVKQILTETHEKAFTIIADAFKK